MRREYTSVDGHRHLLTLRARIALYAVFCAVFAGIHIAAADGAQPPPPDRQKWRDAQRGDPGAAGVDALASQTPAGPNYRSIDGRGNNLDHPRWGSAGVDYLREASGAAYPDGRSAPAGASRPSARVVSNAIVDQGDVETEDERGLSTAIYEFGQFLDHDIGLAGSGSTEAFDIAVPTSDPYFDPAGTGDALIYLDRSAFDPATGSTSARQQINTVTSFIDASQVYGSDPVRAAWLRTFNGGRLKVRVAPAGVLLPWNDGTVSNANPVGLPATSLVVAGDERANEQPGLTVLHTVFLREHNRQARRLARQHPNWGDERLYQEARRVVGAELQAITYNEFLPALLGQPLPPYRGYRADVNPGLSNTFATAAYRFGHSQVGPDIGVIDANFVEVGEIGLADSFFNPTVIPSIGGVDPIVRYMAIDHAQAIDNMIVGPLRNFLFGPPGSGGFDLASLNIQRGRDHGLPSYNTVRTDFGLRPVHTFSQITTNAALAGKLQQLYGSVDDIDAWVGILAEDHVRNGSLGPTAAAVIADQFKRLRDGDRFWYQNAGFGSADLDTIEHTRLSAVLERNSGASGLQPGVFMVCLADFDHSGAVDSRDRDAFMQAYEALSPAADVDGNGTVDQADYDAFFNALAEGC
jgi:peroxidase